MNRHKDESSGSSDDSVKEKKKHKKEKHKEKKHKKKKRKHRTSDSESENEKRSHRKHKKIKRKKTSKEKKDNSQVDEAIPGPSVPTDLMPEHSKSRAPMTKEEWEKSQSVVRRVYDETGRSRLIKGDGEVIEEIVSKKRHREINQQATLGDGLYFENKIYKK